MNAPENTDGPAHDLSADGDRSMGREGNSAHAPKWLRRVLLIATGVCMFAIAGSLISPSWSQADDGAVIRVDGGGTGRGGGAFRAGTMPTVQAQDLIGTLEGTEYRILIHHAAESPTYSVCAPDGRILRDGLHADEIYREFPNLDLRRLHLEPLPDPATGPLMLVYPLD